jgi:hypothetical protein
MYLGGYTKLPLFGLMVNQIEKKRIFILSHCRLKVMQKIEIREHTRYILFPSKREA